MKRVIEDARLTDIADAIRRKKHSKERYLTSDMAHAIDEIKIGIPINVSIHTDSSGVWHRPEEWENMDALQIDYEKEEAYFSFCKMDGMPWCAGFRITCPTNALLEIGHINGGAFEKISEETANNNTYKEINLPDNANTCVIRVTPIGTGHITACKFARISSTFTGRVVNVLYYQQQCVERIGSLPYVNDTALNSTNYGYGAWMIEHDALVIGHKAKVTNAFASAWQYCYSLQSLDLSNWDTSNWAVTTLASAWNGLRSCKIIDIRTWNVNNFKTWVVPTETYSLREYYPPQDAFPVAQNYSAFINLSYDSIIRIIDSLKITATKYNITLGILRAKLTAEEIKVATDKGWNVV